MAFATGPENYEGKTPGEMAARNTERMLALAARGIDTRSVFFEDWKRFARLESFLQLILEHLVGDDQAADLVERRFQERLNEGITDMEQAAGSAVLLRR